MTIRAGIALLGFLFYVCTTGSSVVYHDLILRDSKILFLTIGSFQIFNWSKLTQLQLTDVVFLFAE